MDSKYWDGRGVHVARTNPEHDRRDVEIALTPEAAEALRAWMSKSQLGFLLMDPALGELHEALEYILVGHQRSIDNHRRMQLSKGMTPDGGYRRPYLSPPEKFEAESSLPPETGSVC